MSASAKTSYPGARIDLLCMPSLASQSHHTMKYYAIVPIHSTAIIHTLYIMLAILTLLLLLAIAIYTCPVDVCIEHDI